MNGVPCPSRGKRGWSNKNLAEAALFSIWRKGYKRGPGPMPSRVYKCPCGEWHLTSKPGGSV